jgi:hypothetical protein
MSESRHLLTLRQERSTDKKGWHETVIYNSSRIEEIEDPNGSKVAIPPSSIPTPFAQMHLYDIAFKMVNRLGHEGQTIYNQLVSECLDAIDLIYNLREHLQADKDEHFALIEWNIDERIKSLKNSENDGHQLLGKTIDLFTGELSPFAKNMQGERKTPNMYILTYDTTPIIATSPLTFAFLAPKVNKELISGVKTIDGRDMFTGIRALHQRSEEFQIYVHRLFHLHKNLLNQMDNVHEYLRVQRDKYHGKKGDVIKDIYDESSTLGAFNTDYNDVAINGKVPRIEKVAWKSCAPIITDGNLDSSYLIKPSKSKEKTALLEISPNQKVLPLVLQEGYENPSYKYFRDKEWSNKTKVPFSLAKNKWADRNLPEIGFGYPYLVVTDFLAEDLIRMPYRINDDCFVAPKSHIHDANIDFLLPVTELYFKFFDEETLSENLTIESVDAREGDIKVRLKVPIKGLETEKDAYLVFTRYYDYGNPRNEKNGKIINLVQDWKDDTMEDIPSPFSISIYPFIRTGNPENDTMYKIMLLSSKLAGVDAYSLNAYNEERVIETSDAAIQKISRFERSVEGSHLSIFSVSGCAFDAIEIVTPYRGKTGEKAKGWILPKWKKQPNKGANPTPFTVAIDFGTTNTFVAFTDSNVAAEGNIRTYPFFIGEDDMQTVTLNKPTADKNHVMLDRYDFNDNEIALATTFFQDRMFMPNLIGNPPAQAANYQNWRNAFPIRTALVHADDVQFNPLLNSSISFLYEKDYLDIDRHGQKVSTNLKWSANNSKLVEVFIEQLLYMIRNKILLNGGDLSQTKLVWFKPLSLPKRLTDNLKNLWENKSKELISKSIQVKLVNESEAPYFYYRAIGKVEKSACVVFIDIGGGSTDIALVSNGGRTKLATSAFFGANVLYEGKDTKDPRQETEGGIVSKYRNWFKTQIELTKKGISQSEGARLEIIFNEIMESGKFSSSDKASFMYSAKNINFAEQLSEDQNMLLLFLLHYSACIYHAIQLLAISGMPYPKDFCFSGTGSKYLNLLDVTEKKVRIQKFTEVFARKVYDKYKDLKIDAKTGSSNPLDEDQGEEDNVFVGGFGGFGELNGESNTFGGGDDTNGSINLHLTKEPKEATCFGGIHSFSEVYKNVDLGGNINTIFLGEIDARKEELLPNKQLTYEDLIDQNGNATKQGMELAGRIDKNLDQFLELFLSMNTNSDIRFEDFNIETNLAFFEKGFRQIKQKELAKGMVYERKNASDGGYTPIRESFFFYPLRIIIRDLALAMAQNKINA